MSHLPLSIYSGDRFNANIYVLVPKAVEYFPSIYCFAESGNLAKEIRKYNNKVSIEPKDILIAPFDNIFWTQAAEKRYPNGLPKPYSDDPVQWIFHGHPCGSVLWDEKIKWTAHGPFRCDDVVLQVAVARLLGYRWPAELDAEMELSVEARKLAKECESLLKFVDDDGIVCIPPLRGEASAADRLLDILTAAYSAKWSNEKLSDILKQADHEGKTLETWLRDKFFLQHCQLFHHRPFIWHIWDGLRDGFAALVNYHKLDYKNLENLIYTYLGDWINRQKRDIENGVDGSVEKLDAAEILKKRLELILKGEKPYDIFVRWKPSAEQPIGWNPDLNDGVRLNIRPFMSVPAIGKRGAGVLRDKPNIKWGKDVESAPWYHLGPEYRGKEGDRINDHHLSLAEKKTAKEKIKNLAE